MEDYEATKFRMQCLELALSYAKASEGMKYEQVMLLAKEFNKWVVNGSAAQDVGPAGPADIPF